jgi:hypothetical protein
MLLLIWFPLIFRSPIHFPRTTDLSLNPYLGHWIAVTGVLFLLSAVAFALRLGNRGRRTAEYRRETDYGRATVGQMPPGPRRPASPDNLSPPAGLSPPASLSPPAPSLLDELPEQQLLGHRQGPPWDEWS